MEVSEYGSKNLCEYKRSSEQTKKKRRKLKCSITPLEAKKFSMTWNFPRKLGTADRHLPNRGLPYMFPKAWGTTVRQSSNLKWGGSMYALKFLRFRIKYLPPDALSTKKNDERNWSLIDSIGTTASFHCKRSISKSQADTADGDNFGKTRPWGRRGNKRDV